MAALAEGSVEEAEIIDPAGKRCGVPDRHAEVYGRSFASLERGGHPVASLPPPKHLLHHIAAHGRSAPGTARTKPLHQSKANREAVFIFFVSSGV